MIPPQNLSPGPNPTSYSGASGDGEKLDRVLVRGRAVSVPTRTVPQFCEKYGLSDKIRERLTDAGFQTTGGIVEVSEMSLRRGGFKSGHIAEIKRALKEWLYNHGEPDAPPSNAR
ncbi:hypothetical protein FB451DRAFT_1186664 [Mycena latifolia]|nr:hypothetical protein FB451DRAFT_1186664 [Mycena latifolia]